MKNKRKMPSNFFWGNSVSSMQSEGAWNEAGKGKSVYDLRTATKTSSDWKIAIDEYHRYEEDLDLLKNMHLNMYRIQISWSRVNPTGDGDFNSAGIAYYDRIINAMLKRGITPMVCLYHFDMPLALAKKENGFISKRTVAAFVRFAKKMIDHFADRVQYWLTFNEQNLYFTKTAFRISGYLKGEQTLSAMYTIFHHTVLAHSLITAYIHQNYPSLNVGGMTAYTEVYPASCRPKDTMAVRKFCEFQYNNLNDIFAEGHYSPEVLQFIKNYQIKIDLNAEDLKLIEKSKVDFLAFSYYRSEVFSSDKLNTKIPPNLFGEKASTPNEFLETNEWNWSIDSLGFRNVLTALYNRYGIPVFPVENGIGLKEIWNGHDPINDQQRIDYHRAHIKAMKDAMFIDGAKVLGYLGWGLIDILSSQGDMEKRYGTVYVDRSNHDLRSLQRIPKKSFYWFKSLLEKNGDEL
ncbi:glycoside hydrolase family 1 protein [Liquorilactobacillus vini]|uniref:glycoside hydrolase family 1 protein n=1 Tax=Liquorilactobacillus vini TaxID=238015 RepID=UPI0002D9032B|nr:glycoside hydrolase family 1 protein [Liquorilactobacillus vini]